jgi:hypothetical protein
MCGKKEKGDSTPVAPEGSPQATANQIVGLNPARSTIAHVLGLEAGSDPIA